MLLLMWGDQGVSGSGVGEVSGSGVGEVAEAAHCVLKKKKRKLHSTGNLQPMEDAPQTRVQYFYIFLVSRT